MRTGTVHQWKQEGDISSSLCDIYSSVINYQLVAIQIKHTNLLRIYNISNIFLRTHFNLILQL